MFLDTRKDFGAALTPDFSALVETTVGKALGSVNRVYEWLVHEDNLTGMLTGALQRSGMENFTVTRRLNLSESECKTLLKDQLWVYELHYANTRFRLLEVPVLKQFNSAIVNGIRKCFIFRMKKRNHVFFQDKERGVLSVYFYTTTHNKSGALVYHYRDGRFEIHNGRGERQELGRYLTSHFGGEATALIAELASRGDAREEEPAKIQSASQPTIRSTVNFFAKYLGVDLVPGELFSVANIGLITRVLASNRYIRDNEHLEEMFNLNLSSLGSYLADLCEEHLCGRKLAKLQWDAVTDSAELKKLVASHLGLYELQQNIHQYYYDGSTIQVLEDTNILASLIHSRKVTLWLKYVANKYNTTLGSRDTKLSQNGRICPISSTEGESIGMINHLSLNATVDEYGEVLVPYFRAEKGKLKTGVVYLNMVEEHEHYIADLASYMKGEDNLIARHCNRLAMVARDAVTLVPVVPGGSASLAVTMVPYCNSSEPDRLLMAGNMVRQGLPLKFSQQKHCQTYIEQFVFQQGFSQDRALSALAHAGKDPKRAALLTSRFLASRDEGGVIRLFNNNVYKSNNDKSLSNCAYRPDEDGTVRRYSAGSVDGFALGRNLRVGFVDWKGWNFEDSFVISDKLVKEEAFTSVRLEEIFVPIYKTTAGEERVSLDVINPHYYDLSRLDDDGVIKTNSYVRRGDILVCRLSPFSRQNSTPEEVFLNTILGNKSRNYRNNFVSLPHEIDSGFVESVTYQRGKMTREEFGHWFAKGSGVIDREYREALRVLAVRLYPQRHRKALETWSKYSLFKKHAWVEPEIAAVYTHFQRKVRELENSFSKEECLFGIKVRIFIEDKLSVGDKLTGQHGNKGVLSRVVLRADLPYDERGVPLDFTVSPISIYGRLNLSQVHESYYGGLVDSLNEKIALLEGNRDAPWAERELSSLRSLVGDTCLSRGVRLLSLNFFSQDEELIKKLVEWSGFRASTPHTCGQDGTSFRNDIQRGSFYLMKLVHTARSKYSARAVGANSIKFNQPTRGKYSKVKNRLSSDGSAQKIGTMEKDSLVARHSPALLYELFTLRSDLTNHRKFMVETEGPQSGHEWYSALPESTKALVYFLNALHFKTHFDRAPFGDKKRSFRVSFMSEEEVGLLSRGEVHYAETMHYRHRKEIKGGIFCPVIFGGKTDYSCECGKYQERKFNDIVCPECGVLVTSNNRRRGFFGHISLAYPVVNILALQNRVIRSLFPLPYKDLKDLVYLQKFLWVRPDGTMETRVTWQSEDKNETLYIGSKAIEYLIKRIDLKRAFVEAFVAERKRALHTGNLHHEEQSHLKQLGRFASRYRDLSFLIIKKLLVLPKTLRPLIFVSNGSYISTELNNLYLDIIRRNERLKMFGNFKMLVFVQNHAKLLLQRSVCELFGVLERSNYSCSLLDQIKGKQGLIRKNILSKRINFAGRAVLTLDPRLPLSHCGVGQEMLLKMFMPLVQNKMVEKGIATDVFDAYNTLKDPKFDYLPLLNEVSRSNVVVLNRNPSLHALSIQAFFPVPVREPVINLHPLSCHALGADFDGDTGMVFSVLTPQAQREVTENILENSSWNPSNLTLMVKPSREIAYGLYLMTLDHDGDPSVPEEVSLRDTETLLFLRGPTHKVLFGGTETTLGRLYLMRGIGMQANVYPGELLREFNRPFDNATLDALTSAVAFRCGNNHTTNRVMDFLKREGNHWGTVLSTSFPRHEFTPLGSLVQEAKENLRGKVFRLQDDLRNSVLSEEDYELQLVNFCHQAEERVERAVTAALEGSKHAVVVNSGFRGSWINVMAMGAMRGLSTNRRDYILPVTSSLYDGYSEVEFAVLSNVRRKLINKSLGTASGGYFNRKMVELLREKVVEMEDCDTSRGFVIRVHNRRDAKNWWGRVLNKPCGGLPRGHVLSYQDCSRLLEAVETVEVRSPLTCEAPKGVCQKCYGHLVGRFGYPQEGLSVGTLAAHALAEPVTQMSMKTKHSRGVSLDINADMTLNILSSTKGQVELVDITPTHEGRYLGTDVAAIRVGNETVPVYHGDVVHCTDGDRVERDGLLLRRPIRNSRFAPFPGKVSFNEAGDLVLRGEDGEFRVLSGTGVMWRTSQDKKVERGHLLAEVVEEAKESMDAFKHLVNIIFFNANENLSRDLTVRHDSTVTFRRGILTCRDQSGVFTATVESCYNVVRTGRVSAGTTVYLGRNGQDPAYLIRAGAPDEAVTILMDQVTELYKKEGIEIHSVNLELLMHELLLKGVSSLTHKERNINYLRKHSVPGTYYHLNKSLNQIYTVGGELLSSISYENFVKFLLRGAVTSETDPVESVNAKLVMGVA